MFKLTGTVKVVKDTVQVTEKFAKREFVINDTSSMYPQDILFQSVQDKCDMLDGIAEGEEVEVSFNLRGREWTSPQGEVKYFNTLDAWRIETVNASNEHSDAQTSTTQASTETSTETEKDDGVPF
jgi:hypothetical protein